jgi:hypothetical protein
MQDDPEGEAGFQHEMSWNRPRPAISRTISPPWWSISRVHAGFIRLEKNVAGSSRISSWTKIPIHDQQVGDVLWLRGGER